MTAKRPIDRRKAIQTAALVSIVLGSLAWASWISGQYVGRQRDLEISIIEVRQRLADLEQREESGD